ncbi:hypothetical protein HY214_03915 [Candidatus Roizmanbacteria bacterium]|nr:hypothetical protein [Candidatus Roizmanbacteria bacterium]
MKKALLQIVHRAIVQALTSYLQATVTFFLFLVFVGYVFINLVLSQSLPTLFFRVAAGERTAMLTFLTASQGLPEYKNIVTSAEEIYGHSIIAEFRDQLSRRHDRIGQLDQTLAINPKARDVLLELSRLYAEEKNQVKTNDYLTKAKKIDPGINQ